MNDTTYLNHMYLHCLRSAAAASLEAASARFGVDLDLARWAAALSAQDIDELAESNYVFFRLTFDQKAFNKALAAPKERREILLGLAPKFHQQKTAN